MEMNLAVKSLLSWVNSLKLRDSELTIDDLQDGLILLRLVYMLKKQPIPCLNDATEDRFRVIAEFLERDCRFNASKSSSLRWDHIRDGISLTAEISKVLLLLVYHDMMNDHCTLNMLDCDVERELAHLTSSFVMESEGCVYLSEELDAHLRGKHLTFSQEIFEQSAATSGTNMSSISSFLGDESPFFHRNSRIKFVDIETVASSSVSSSPLEDVMNTPKFQLRKMQRQMIKERDYRDSLERELASKIALIEQRESRINQLQYRLDKLKEEQGDQEHVTKEQINELEIKNNDLQKRLNEMLKQNKDLKTNTSLMERKVDELADENGVLSSQVRAVCSQLAAFETEVGRLTESQASAQEEWRNKRNHLQSELNQATAQKELLTEQIQILQGKISCLEDEISKASKDEVGENMGPIVEREMLETEIRGLKNELETTHFSLKKAELEIHAKTQQLEECHQEIKEIHEQRGVLQEEIRVLKLQLEQVEQQKNEQTDRLQQHIAACEQEIKKLQEIKQAKEDLLHQTEEKVNDLETKLTAATSLLAVKEQQINSLKDEVDILTDETNKNKDEIQAKEEELAKLLLEKSNVQETLSDKIQILTAQVEDLSSSLKQAEQEIHMKQDLLDKTAQENVQQIELLQQQSAEHMEALEKQKTASREEIKRLNADIHAKEEQMARLETEASTRSALLQQELDDLNNQIKSMTHSLEMAKDHAQAREAVMAKQQEESTLQIEELGKHISVLEAEVNRLKQEIQTKEAEVDEMKTNNCMESEALQNEIQSLQGQVQCLNESLKTATEQAQVKENLLKQKEFEFSQEKDSLQNMMMTSEDEVKRLREQVEAKEEQLVTLRKEGSIHSDMLEQEIETLKNQVCDMRESLTKAEEKVKVLQAELSVVKTLGADKDQSINTLREEVTAQANVIQKTKAEAEASEKLVAEIKQESSKQTYVLQNEIQDLKEEVERLLAKEQKLVETQQESAQQINLLQQQLASAAAELTQHEATQVTNIRLKETVQEMQVTTLKEKETLVQEKQVLLVRILQAEKDYEAIVFEKERLLQANLALKRENVASRKLESVLQQELEILKMENEKLLKEQEKAEEIELIKRDLQEQLATKSEAAEHYKAQMEKAANHYNSKKQLLQKSQEEVDALKLSLEAKEREMHTMIMEKKVLQLDLDKAQANEKTLSHRVASLEAQLACADQNLRVQNKIHANGGSATSSCFFEVPYSNSGVCTRAQVKRAMSSDSLDQSSMEDSLNSTRKLSAPDESSTPLVRSSERLAAKRRGLKAESLETLYFTPINTRQVKRTGAEEIMDSTQKNPTSSVKRRRTTQVINITMTKKTPGCGEADETFYSLASARSQPNLANANSARPVSMELFDTPARRTSSASDQLIGLPGYRRSTIHVQPTSTFCVGAENEPDGGPEDWLRIAELQSRNKACLPHLKSSYPVESETGRSGPLVFTDEELRTGDPSDTIRRASMVPSQLRDSLISHRQSLMLGQVGAAAGTRSDRLSLMPGQLPSRTASSYQLRSPKGTKQPSSTLSLHQTSPEKKMKASCFPRPLTPKNRSVSSGPSSSTLRAALSPAERRQSMMFTIENTPKSNNYLKKHLNKLRSSARKSPGDSLKKSPAQTSARKHQEKMPSGSSRGGVRQAGRTGNFKSPQVVMKGSRKSPQAASRSAKSPGLTASARKMMRRMKV
ncbi:nuclear mitotic apparatus protein 1 [Haplochromis burtoni]|uniref:nuclear mitotic apparatus protein 1 n=1 Tax=Haplochromis burtoni TaxID=8153 RepID=UPI0006C9DBFA|nr:nuclear mitotic apparatus protein 1 [Haplochromis burtoni]